MSRVLLPTELHRHSESLKWQALPRKFKETNVLFTIRRGYLVNLFLRHYKEKVWLRGSDSNRRPPGYEPDELPDCSTPLSYIFITNSIKVNTFLPELKIAQGGRRWIWMQDQIGTPMPEAGLEPARVLNTQWILSPLRLPIPPLRQNFLFYYYNLFLTDMQEVIFL